MSTGLQKTPIYRAMNRPTLFMGGDRELVLCSMVTFITMIFTSLNVIIILASIGMLLLIIHGLRVVAKSDPQMRNIYLRHIKYKSYYPAQSQTFYLEK